MTTSTIPWWGKISAKLLLSRIPFGYAVWRRLGFFRHGEMDTSEYAIRVFNSHAERTGLADSLCGKTILELGPGDSIATAIIAKAHGGRAILVDVGAFVRADIAPYLTLGDVLARQGLTPPSLSDCRTIDDILARCESRYLTAGLTSLRQLDAASVDLIFSQAVLEHVRKKDVLETMREFRRILKSDGICSHQIDLRDHLGGALNNLRFHERIWESDLFASSGFYTNRIRFNHMLNLIEQAGFHADVSGVGRWTQLPTSRSKLAAEFRALNEEDLLVYQFDVVLR
jgi:SAM-dependent methyltransferase